MNKPKNKMGWVKKPNWWPIMLKQGTLPKCKDKDKYETT